MLSFLLLLLFRNFCVSITGLPPCGIVSSGTRWPLRPHLDDFLASPLPHQRSQGYPTGSLRLTCPVTPCRGAKPLLLQPPTTKGLKRGRHTARCSSSPPPPPPPSISQSYAAAKLPAMAGLTGNTDDDVAGGRIPQPPTEPQVTIQQPRVDTPESPGPDLPLEG